MIRFETANDCKIEPNQVIDLLMIHCAKDKATQVRANFDDFVAKIK